MKNNIHPHDSFELAKFKMMMSTLERLLEDDNLEICSKTVFDHKDDNGVEYSVEGYCIMPLYQTVEFDGHFEFRFIKEIHDADAMRFDIRFYNNGIMDTNEVEVFKAVFDVDKYDDYDVEDKAYKLYADIRVKYMEVQNELERLAELMQGIVDINKNESGTMIGELDHRPPKPPQQNGGPKPPYTPPPARPYDPDHPQLGHFPPYRPYK